MSGRLAAALLAAGLAAACTAAPGGQPTVTPAPGPTAAGATAAPPAAAGFVRTCESSVHGELDAGWRRDSVVAGPLAFAYLKETAGWPAGEFRRRQGGYRSQKTLVVVEAGATVTVTVPVAERRHLALLYDPSAWKLGANLYRVADGEPVVTFQGCRPSEHPYGAEATQFNGGFVVAGPRCVTLEVSPPAWAAPRRVPVSFGAGRCRG